MAFFLPLPLHGIGLVVPVLRNTETMSFKDVESTIAMFGAKAKEGNLALEDMAGGTFTISNGGVFGSLMGTPIINPPQRSTCQLQPASSDPHALSVHHSLFCSWPLAMISRVWWWRWCLRGVAVRF